MLKLYIIYSVVALASSRTIQNKFSQSGHNFSPEVKHALMEDPTAGCSVWKQEKQVYEAEDIIKYEGLTYNRGNHYNPQTGEFKCPTTGVYYVSATACKVDRQPLHLSVVKDGNITRPFILLDHNHENNTQELILSNSAIVSCNANQVLSVVAQQAGAIYGHVTIARSYFTVVQLDIEDNALRRASSAHTGNPQVYEDGDRIRFRLINYNSLGDYNPLFSQYTCPVTGVYFISVNIAKDTNAPVTTCMKTNTRPNLVMQDTNTLVHSNVISNSGLHKCFEGDIIDIQAIGSGAINGQPYLSTFNAFLVNKDTSCDDYSMSSNDNFVGFSAFSTLTRSYEVNDVLVFDSIIINDGGYYNPDTNTFTCLVAGTYFVSVNLRRAGSSTMSADLKVQTLTVTRLQDTEADSTSGCVSYTTVVSCLQGWTINVVATTDCTVFGNPFERSSSFTIFQLSLTP